jgi:hypothetical protein
MTPYQASYQIRYQIPSLQAQIEVAGVKACEDIKNEPVDTPDHEERANWAIWYSRQSAIGWIAFAWGVAMNPTIQAAIQTDPTGGTVVDTDVQFVVNSMLPVVIADWNKQMGGGASMAAAMAYPPPRPPLPPPPSLTSSGAITG